MEIKIEGNPGIGNCFTEIHIGNVQNYNPNATTVINHNYGTRVSHQASGDGDEVDKESIRSEIVKYVMKTLDFVSEKWKNHFEALWTEILKLKDVDAEVYNKGGQQGTVFNRVLVAGIIHVLMDCKVYNKCTYTALAIALENNEEHHVRQELGRNPSEEIQTAIKELMQKRKK